MRQNNNKERIMFVDSKKDIAHEVNHINCTLGQISEIDRRLRVENRRYIDQINELNNKLVAQNKRASEQLLSATQRAKNSERLRFRDVIVILGLFAAFAMYVSYVSL